MPNKNPYMFTTNNFIYAFRNELLSIIDKLLSANKWIIDIV